MPEESFPPPTPPIKDGGGDNNNPDNKSKKPLLCLLAPCYNEAEIIAESLAEMESHLAKWKERGLVDGRSFCCFVDDGSADDTWRILSRLLRAPHRAVKLAFNAGHQNALHAGVLFAAGKCDCCVSIDADLQDDLAAVPEMLAAHANGADVVYGVRASRASDSFFKRNTARLFYALSSALGVPGRAHHADFRLLSGRAMRALAAFGESHLYLRGLLAHLNFPSAAVEYARRPRIGGETKYPPAKMLLLAFNGITSFSIVPLRLITFLGILVSAFAFVSAVWLFANKLAYGGDWPRGWATIVVSQYFLGGVILLSLGIIGEYIGKTFIESKRRPLYVVEKTFAGGGENGRAPPADGVR